MNENFGLRERKKRQTSERIESAALELFEASGFDGTTVDEIAARADISPRTFFYYFPTKEDVVLANYAGRLERIVGELGRRPAHEAPWLALRSSFLVVAADYDGERHEIVRRFTIMASASSIYARSLQIQAGWEDTLASALSERMGCDLVDLRPRLLASCALGAIRSSLQHWIATGQEESLPRLVEICFDQLATGLDDLAQPT